VSANRILVAGATTSTVRRTTVRKAFLAPWHPMVRDIWLYALADAQRKCDVAIHHGILVLNHEHLNVTPSRDNLPEFMHRVHHDVSCALSTLLSNHRYDSAHELWDGREPHYMRLLDEGAQMSQLVYEHLNCVAAGLVERPEHMPDFTFDFDLWKTGALEVERPAVFFGKERPERLRLEVTPPPLLYRAFGGDLERLVYHMGRVAESAMKRIRGARKRPVIGVKKVLRLHPWNEPRTLRETGGAVKPTFRVGARGILAMESEIACALEVRAHRARYRQAFAARRRGDAAVAFPFGTYQMRVVHRAPVETSPMPDAIVAMPGPLLCDVKAELERSRAPREQTLVATRALLDEVSGAFAHEAVEIERHNAVAFDDVPIPGSSKPDTTEDPDGTEPHSVIVRHRFGKRNPVDKSEARRIVVLRDRRRGRPSSNRRGNDPPE
jgi:hypothetical protein